MVGHVHIEIEEQHSYHLNWCEWTDALRGLPCGTYARQMTSFQELTFLLTGTSLSGQGTAAKQQNMAWTTVRGFGLPTGEPQTPCRSAFHSNRAANQPGRDAFSPEAQCVVECGGFGLPTGEPQTHRRSAFRSNSAAHQPCRDALSPDAQWRLCELSLVKRNRMSASTASSCRRAKLLWRPVR